MTKSENAWEDREEMERVWGYIKENPLIIGLPVSERRGIDLLSALRDIYETNKTNTDGAQVLLTMLANVLVAASQGDGEEIEETLDTYEVSGILEKKAKSALSSSCTNPFPIAFRFDSTTPSSLRLLLNVCTCTDPSPAQDSPGKS